jgi:hypothetical protein
MDDNYLGNSSNGYARPGTYYGGIYGPYLSPDLPSFAAQSSEPSSFEGSISPLDSTTGSRTLPNPDTPRYSLFGNGAHCYPNDGCYDTRDSAQDRETPYPWAVGLTTVTPANPMQRNQPAGYDNNNKAHWANPYGEVNPNQQYSVQQNHHASYNAFEAPQPNPYGGEYSIQRRYPAGHSGVVAAQAGSYSSGHVAPQTAFGESQYLAPTYQSPTHPPPDGKPALPESAENSYPPLYVPPFLLCSHSSPNSDAPSPPKPPSDRSSSPTENPLRQGRKQRPHICYSCKRDFERSTDLTRHIKSLHSRPPVEELFHCLDEGCNRKGPAGFVRKDKLLSHTKARHGGK